MRTLILATALFLAAATTQAADKRPNFLLVMADDMGWTDLGCYGSEIETPNIDAIAKRGVKFSDFHVSVSCSPTRSMLLTGNDNHIAGLGNMDEVVAPNQRGAPGASIITPVKVVISNNAGTKSSSVKFFTHTLASQVPSPVTYESRALAIVYESSNRPG